MVGVTFTMTMLAICSVGRAFPLFDGDVVVAGLNESLTVATNWTAADNVTVVSLNASEIVEVEESAESAARARQQRNAFLPIPGGKFPEPDSVLREQTESSVSRSLKPVRGSKRAFNMTRINMLKQSWCKTEVFELVVKAPGCIPKTLLNHYCYGQCNSFFIPRVSKQRNDAAFHSSATCQPDRVQLVRIVLDCPLNARKRQVRFVQDVRECKCSSSTSTVASRFDFY